jgi:single-strand DNA-binding protein
MNTNVLVLTGRLGRDPELRYTGEGTAICNFSIAVNRYGDKPAMWVKVGAWGKLGERCNQYLRKGSLVTASGRLEPSGAWIKDEEARSSNEMTALNVEFLADWGDNTEDVPVEEEIPF